MDQKKTIAIQIWLDEYPNISLSGFGYIDFVSIWNKQMSRYPMVWMGKNNDMNEKRRKLFFQLEKPSATSREAFVLHDREERGYSSNHDDFDDDSRRKRILK